MRRLLILIQASIVLWTCSFTSSLALAEDNGVRITPGKSFVRKNLLSTHMGLSRNSNRLIVGDQKGNVIVWDFERDETIFTEQIIDGPVTAVAISDDGTHVLAGGFAGQLVHIALDAKLPKKKALNVGKEKITGIAFEPKLASEALISTGLDEGHLYSVNLKTGLHSKVFDVAKSDLADISYRPGIIAMHSKPSSGKILVSIGPAAALLDAKTKRKLGVIDGRKSEITHVHLFEDESAVALVHLSDIHICSVPELKLRTTIKLVGAGGTGGLGTLPKSTLLVATVSPADDLPGKLVIWDYKANKLVSERECSPVYISAFCLDGERGIAAVADNEGKVAVFNIAVKDMGK